MTEDIDTAVNQIWDQFSSALNSGDLDVWLSLWTDDGVQMPDGEPAVVGKQRIRERMKNVFDQFNLNMVITNKEAASAGELAYARGTYKFTVTPKAGGQAAVFDGKYMTIFEKQPDGSWKIHRDIFNSNVPASEGTG